MEESGAKLFTIELAFGHKPFEVTSSSNPMNMQLRTKHILWHKERLINLAVKHLKHIVPDIQYIGWYDSDITFVNPNWVHDVVHKLSYVPIIQPYSTAINLNSNEDFMWACPSSFRSFVEKRGYHQHPPLPVSYTYKGHPGLAWNMTIEAFEAIGGLYDKCIAGSADTIMSNVVKGDWSAFLPGSPSDQMKNSIEKWHHVVSKVLKNHLGFTHGCLLHHWHGASESRGYEKRWDILSFHKFDPMVDIEIDDNGLYRWAGNKPQLEDDIRLSLGSRNEDALS